MPRRRETLAGILSAQGFGARKECARLIRAGAVSVGRPARSALPGLDPGASPIPAAPPAGYPEPQAALGWETAADPDCEFDPDGVWFRIGGVALPFREALYLAFHKPADCECSHAPAHHRSIYSFFPEPFLRRGLEAVGRLDADTTGLLLLSDSGEFIHHLISPRRHVSKTYRVDLKHPVTAGQMAGLASGVALRGDKEPTMPARIATESDRRCLLTLEEGRYHQVKRMFGAVGNRVEAIHRIAVGPIALDADLAPGSWRYLSEAEVDALAAAGGR